jgi:hypothetical protein
MYLAKNVAGWSTTIRIGRFYNGWHHTMMLHAIAKISAAFDLFPAASDAPTIVGFSASGRIRVPRQVAKIRKAFRHRAPIMISTPRARAVPPALMAAVEAATERAAVRFLRANYFPLQRPTAISPRLSSGRFEHA